VGSNAWHVGPELVFLFDELVLTLFLGKRLEIKVEPFAEILVCAP